MAAAIGAQVLWGIFPAFIKLFKGIVEPVDLVAHRAVWSFAFLILLLLATSKSESDKSQTNLRQRLFGNASSIRKAMFATVFIAINWLVFVWSVSAGHALDASLGYYICPQFVVLLGVVFLGERLSKVQWIAIAIAAVGVIIMTGSNEGKVWIGLLIAAAFAIYALIKKKTTLSAVEGLTLETGFMLIPAILFLVWRSNLDGIVAFPDSTSSWLLLISAGPMTVAPLFLYAFAVKHISLSTAGLLQFIGPTIQFCLGVFAFAEPVDSTRLIGFVCVWTGVSIYLYALSKRSPANAK